MSRTMLKRLVAIIAGTLAGLSPTFADPVEDFYRGSTIRLHVSASVGGGYDHVARLFIKYFPQYLPGRPNMIVVNAPGAAGVVMSNSLYNVAPKDGTVLGMANLTMPMNQVITPAQVRYDANKFHWLGNLEESNGSIFTWHTSPTKTFQDAAQAGNHDGCVVACVRSSTSCWCCRTGSWARNSRLSSAMRADPRDLGRARGDRRQRLQP